MPGIFVIKGRAMKKDCHCSFQALMTITVLLVAVLFSEAAEAIEKSLIFPLPQEMQLSNDVFVLDENLIIAVPENPGKNDLFLARFLVRELSDKYGIAVKIEPFSVVPADKRVVVMGRFDNPLIRKYCEENHLTVNEKSPGPEGYLLEVNSRKIVIAGSDDPGAFYGLQSLRQLMVAGSSPETWSCPKHSTSARVVNESGVIAPEID